MSHPNPGDHDIIQLTEDAVFHLLPPYATENDMYEALDRCGLTQRQIFDELDRRPHGAQSPEELSVEIEHILFETFSHAIAEVTDHKAPLYGP